MLIEEEGVVFKDEVVFEDGSVYKGQCKDEGNHIIKHGYGVLLFPDGTKY